MEKQMKSKNPWVTILVNLLTPGLSYVYLGAIKRLTIFWIILISTYSSIGLSGVLKMPFGIFLVYGIIFTIVLIGYIDCFRLAKITDHDYQTSYAKTPIYIFIVFICLLLIMYIKPNFDRTILEIGYFKMTHNNFEPELKMGDGILIDFGAYKKDRPKDGDFVVIENNENLLVRKVIVLQSNQDTIYSRFNSLPYLNHPERVPKSEDQVRESMKNFNILKKDSIGTFKIDSLAKEDLIKNTANTDYLEPEINKFSYPIGGKLVGKVIYIYSSDDISRIGKL